MRLPGGKETRTTRTAGRRTWSGLLATAALAATTAALVSAAPVGAGSFSPLDPGFGTGGVVHPTSSGPLVVRGDGSILLGSELFTADGHVDASYVAPTATPLTYDTAGQVPRFVLDPDGRTIRRLLPNGADDPAFTPFVLGASDVFSALAESANGRVTVVFAPNGRSHAVERLDASGTPDPSFGTNGRLDLADLASRVHGVVAFDDGGVVVAGVFHDEGPSYVNHGFVWSFDRSGAPTTTMRFDTPAVSDLWIGRGPTTITVAWSIGPFAGRNRDTYVRRSTGDGALDPSFGLDGVAVVPTVSNALGIGADGSVVGASGVDSDLDVWRLDGAGRLDATVGRCGVARLSTAGRLTGILGVAGDAAGRILLLGAEYSDPSAAGVPFLARFTAAPETSPTACGGLFRSVSARRLLDTRDGTGGVPAVPVVPGGQLDVRIGGADLGSGGLMPTTGISAALLTVTATNALAAGFVTAWATGAERPTASILNLAGTGDTAASLVMVPIGPDGRLSLYTQQGADLLVDVTGYVSVMAGAHVHLLAPTRLLDTRESSGTVAGGGTVIIDGSPPVPPGTLLANLFGNLTATNTAGDGFVSVGDFLPEPVDPPTVSNLNVSAGQTRANGLVFMPGQRLFTHASADLVVDATGYASPDGPGELVAIAPTRVLDTREAGAQHARVHAGETITVHVIDPAAYDAPVTGVVITLTAVDSGGPGFLTAWATGDRPLVSNLNVDAARQTRPNAAFVPVDARGDIQLYSHGAADVVIDVTGILVDHPVTAAALP